jgi:hypothetical protein
MLASGGELMISKGSKGGLMKASALALAVLLCSGAAAIAQEAPEALRPDQVSANLVGKKISVEGRIYSNSKSEAGIHLYFSPDTTTAFQAIIVAKSVYKFQVDVTKKFVKRNVRVTGKLETEAGKFFIRVDDPSLIKTVARKTES